MDQVKPTVGRIVYYKSRGSADGVFPPKEIASIITAVHEDGSIAIATFYETGLRFEQNTTQGEGIGQWDWMPFQKDQQARLANDAKTLVVGGGAGSAGGGVGVAGGGIVG